MFYYETAYSQWMHAAQLASKVWQVAFKGGLELQIPN